MTLFPLENTCTTRFLLFFKDRERSSRNGEGRMSPGDTLGRVVERQADAPHSFKDPVRCPSPSLWNQSQDDDFGWDSESHGKYTRADSSGNDQFLSVLLHQTVRITLTEAGRHDQPAGNGHVHLSAVRVSGESQADSFRHFGKQIGVMHEHK